MKIRLMMMLLLASCACADTWLVVQTPASLPTNIPPGIRVARMWLFRSDPVARLYTETRPIIPATEDTIKRPTVYSDEYDVVVPVTGTVAEAVAELPAAWASANPSATNLATVLAETGDTTPQHAARRASTNAAAANSVPALRAEIARLARLVAALEERNADERKRKGRP